MEQIYVCNNDFITHFNLNIREKSYPKIDQTGVLEKGL